jgi:sec-independent protein translocase protein TatA
MPFGLGFGEMLLICAVLLMLFGAKRLPEVAAGMGKGIRDFKRALNGVDDPSIQSGIVQSFQTGVAQPLQAPVVQAAPQQMAAPVEVVESTVPRA